MTTFSRVVACLLSASLAFGPAVHAATPGLIGTQQAAAAGDTHGARDRLATLLDRADLAAALEARGVSPAAAQARVAALTDDEAAEVLARVDQLPAGGDVVGALFAVFVILLVTDILGLTKVFPFTRSVR